MKKLISDEKTPNSSMKNIRGGIQGHHAPKINGGRPQGIMHLDSGGDLKATGPGGDNSVHGD